MADGFSTSYVPYSGLYRVRTHACPGTQAGNCTLGSSAQTFDSRNAVQLQSGAKIVDQTPDFGGGAGQLATSSTICFTFVSDDGSEWSTSAKRTCQDAPRLPEKPSFCYLNSGVDLDVDMGTIERGMISTVPGSTTKKTVPLKVMCSGDAAATTTMKFEYTPVTIVGSEVVSADKAGLGVAIFIDDKLMTTKETVTQTFQPGVTTVNLGFEVVRDPYVNIGTIGTGSFNADAVMILTKQ
ncbi:hypothetical protein LJPFL01_3476 [Lelliottia jeotgali]|nr:hypothetical protein LJPFL01_3476 [Lelliottia jeotgali]